jgi:hypothetical protein
VPPDRIIKYELSEFQPCRLLRETEYGTMLPVKLITGRAVYSADLELGPDPDMN